MNPTDTAGLRTQLRQAFEFRHAAKSFDPTRKISAEDFDLLLEVARLSPTSFGFEPWRLLVVQNPEVREAMKAVSWGAQGQLPTASHFVVFTVLRGQELDPQGPYLSRLLTEVKQMPADRQAGMKAKFADFLAKEFRLDTPEKVTHWAARQAYIVLGNMMTAAAVLGIDSCPIEGFDQAQLEAVLDGQGGYDKTTHAVVCTAAFGYRAQEPRPKVRKPLAESVAWV